MSIFQPNYVIVDQRLIPLRHIESMCLMRDHEDLVVDRLNGDLILEICTLSGKEYQISMKHQLSVFADIELTTDLNKLGRSIINKWSYIITIMDNK